MPQRVYYIINEDMAEAANDANSMRPYQRGEATAAYKRHVNEVYDIADEIKEKKPYLYDKALTMVDRYARRLANYYNSYYRNEASCPSVLISGAGNFPTAKKNRQNDRRGTLNDEWKELERYAEKIENLLTHQQSILADDENAIERLEEKLEALKQRQQDMKDVNAYYRKNGTLDGCEVLTEEDRENIETSWARGWYVGTPFPTYELSNNNKRIHATEDRIAILKSMKNTETSATEYDGFKLVENTEIMRLQFIFDGKPEQEVRDTLKANGFKWSPKNNAWQRQLTDNARYAAKQVIKSMEG